MCSLKATTKLACRMYSSTSRNQSSEIRRWMPPLKEIPFRRGGGRRLASVQDYFGFPAAVPAVKHLNEILRRKYSSGDKDQQQFKPKKRIGIHHSLMLFALGTCTCGGIVVLWSHNQLKRTFSRSLGVSDASTSKKYVYPFDPGDVGYFIKKHCFLWLPSGMLVTPAAWKLFLECSQPGPQREIAIAKLSTLDNLLDFDCLHFAHALDLSASLALAHSGADPRLFQSPPTCSGFTDTFKTYFGNSFRSILDPLPSQNIHFNLNYILRSVLATYVPNEEEEQQYAWDLFSGFEVEPKLHANPPEISEGRFLKVCLQATISHTRDPSLLKEMPKTQLLDLLVVISGRYGNNVEIMSLVLKVLANLSCDPSYADDIRNSGCLRILAEAAKTNEVRLLLPAKRALHNLDRESSKHILPSGVYQLYPDFRTDESLLEYDIVFIHGILGGVFRTWRQQDRNATLLDESVEHTPQPENVVTVEVGDKGRMASKILFKMPDETAEEVNKHRSRTEVREGTFLLSDEEIPVETEHIDSPSSQCWPRDWLPFDCPNARIVAVDFDSFVTHWSGFCPVETTKRSLADRAGELLQKLHQAGVGERPIIFVTHSMGGLLAKSILCQAALASKEYENICKNTKGIIFCSVPHAGSYIALANTTRRYIFMPTEEALELTNNNSSLTLLHERFLRLWRAYKFKVLSVGEMLETKSLFKVAFKMVPFSSADPGIGDFYPVKLNHLNTCKPHCRGSFVYQKIVEFIHKLTDDVDDKK